MAIFMPKAVSLALDVQPACADLGGYLRGQPPDAPVPGFDHGVDSDRAWLIRGVGTEAEVSTLACQPRSVRAALSAV